MKYLTIMLVMMFSLTSFAGFPKFQRMTQEFLWDVTAGASADSTLSSGTINIFSVPAGTVIFSVNSNVETVVSGSSSEIVGDGGDTNGYLVDGFMNATGLSWATLFVANIGDYLLADNSDVASGPAIKFYSSADTIDFIVAGSATAGKVRFFIDFMVME